MTMRRPSDGACLWCGRGFTPRVDGGKRQVFCREACRRAFDAAGRQWVAEAIAGGMLTVDALRNGAAATRALPSAAISPPPVSQGRVQPGKVPGPAETVEDNPSVAQPREGVDAALPSTADMAAEHVELSRLEPTGAEPPPESTRLFEVDPARLWGPRLTLWQRRRIWAPEWGPRPDQDGCLAPDYLL